MKFLNSFIEWIGSHVIEIIPYGISAVRSMMSKLENMRDLLKALSKIPPVIDAVIVSVSALVNVIALITTSIDVHQGSKTELAAKLRKHVELLEKDRNEISEAVQSL